MKCEVCLQLLEEYIDGELREAQAAPINAHLVTCAGCGDEFEALTAEQEIYARYDRELDIAPAMWNEIAARTVEAGRSLESQPRFHLREWFAVPSLAWSFAGALAILLIAAAIGTLYFRSPHSTPEEQTRTRVSEPGQPKAPTPVKENVKSTDLLAADTSKRAKNLLKPNISFKPSKKVGAGDQSDVLFSDMAYSAVEEQETQAHLENAQNLLRSVRNIEISEDDSEVDVSYEKALSRRLLNENIVLRRDAEMSGKFPTKILLSDLEPFLIDIANLPDKPAANDLRVLKERVSKTEIVAALQGY